MVLSKKRLLILLLAIPCLLFIPFIAMQFTNEVNWAAGDFFVMGTLLLFTVLVIEGLFRLSQVKKYRGWLIAAVLLIFCLIWAELAVGIFNTPFAGN